MNKLDSFHIKLIAITFMIIDHIGVFFLSSYPDICFWFRLLGRISFPLFAFMISEGVSHTKHPIRYFTSLFIIGCFMDLFEYFAIGTYQSNAVTTFFYSGLFLYLLFKVKGWYKLFAIIPLVIGCMCDFSFFPIRMEYGTYGFLLVILFYLSTQISRIICNKSSYDNPLLLQKIISILFITTFHFILYALQSDLYAVFTAITIDFSFQTYSLISCIFILFYTGKLGYTSTAFKWGCYLFYPLHLLILYGISAIVGII